MGERARASKSLDIIQYIFVYISVQACRPASRQIILRDHVKNRVWNVRNSGMQS